MNMFVFCHQVFRSKVFNSENICVYISECLVIYKFLTHALAKVSVYIYGPGHDKKVPYDCVDQNVA